VLPAHCAACGAPSPAESRLPLCQPCSRALAACLEEPFCLRCGRHIGPHTVDKQGECLFCRLYPIRHEATVRVGSYEEPLKSLILKCKHSRRPDVASLLGRLLSERVALTPWADRVDVVAPVPLHWSRRLNRGFNQADMIAGLVVAAGIGRLGRRVLRRVRPTPLQSGLPASARAGNVRGAFRPGSNAADIAGCNVLLVDDVMTSGSTVAECVKVLKKAGAADVYVAIVATASFDHPGPW